MIKPRGAFLVYFLAAVMAFFVGVLIYVWVEAKKANPVMLDERGQPISLVMPPALHRHLV